jgi:hypothetical protein
LKFFSFYPKRIWSSLEKISIPIQVVFGWQVRKFQLPHEYGHQKLLWLPQGLRQLDDAIFSHS